MLPGRITSSGPGSKEKAEFPFREHLLKEITAT
jgi:hypothetical protein